MKKCASLSFLLALACAMLILGLAQLSPNSHENSSNIVIESNADRDSNDNINGNSSNQIERNLPSAVTYSPQTPVIPCSSSNRIVLSPGKTYRLALSPPGVLCTLTRVLGDQIVPVGRSYDNHEWEAVAGPYNTLSYNCDEKGYFCEVYIAVVPSSTSSDRVGVDEYVFHLSGFEHSLSTNDEAARFFEQATFGVTHSDLVKVQDFIRTRARSNIGSSSINSELLSYFARWVYDQTYVIHPTSHRAVWRERASPIYDLVHREGRATSPCEEGSIWRNYAFTEYDRKKPLIVEEMNGRYALKVDDEIRTMVNSFEFIDFSGTINFSKDFQICRVEEKTYGKLLINYKKNGCKKLKGGNPSVSMQGMEPEALKLHNLEIEESKIMKGRIEIFMSKNRIDSDKCDDKQNEGKNFFTRVSNGNYDQDFIFEPHLVLQGNTIQNPIDDGGRGIVQVTSRKAQCINAPRTFLNEENCRLSSDIACASQEYVDLGLLHLTSSNIKIFYEEARRYVYAVSDLHLHKLYQKSPCIQGIRSRWQRQSIDHCEENVNVHAQTASIFQELFEKSDDSNPYVRDLLFPSGKLCHESDMDEIHMVLKSSGECWRTVHPNHLNVYDFSTWGNIHPGNVNGNPIRRFAKRGSHILEYPGSHPMSRWDDMHDSFPFIGRLGDMIEFKNLPSALRTTGLAEAFGLVQSKGDAPFTVICGSPYETANYKKLTPGFSLERRKKFNVLPTSVFEQQRRTVWTMVTTAGVDQLRQRVAWALSQIFAISPEGVPSEDQAEVYLSYYDIFVRNAMGNYRDVLKEVAFSPVMAQMLSYLESKSSAYIWNHHKEIQFADENFAREIMQLFTVGLVELNDDGTEQLDSSGRSIPVYNNNDITEYARLWTGFRRQQQRGNTEERERDANNIDPMSINKDWRDQFPKFGLGGKYVGDSYALCSELPSDSFLRKGAKYRLLGNSKKSDLQNILTRNIIPQLDGESLLRDQLCAPDSNGACSFPAVVHLRENLDCHGGECNPLVDPQLIQVDENVYYEYIRTPCVWFPFSKIKHPNIVIDPEGKVAITQEDLPESVESLTYFRVQWENDFPQVGNSCANGACIVWSGRCVCQTTVEDSRVFDSLPSRDEVLSMLYIGAMSPHLKDYQYSRPFRNFGLFYKKNEMFGMDTAFQIKDEFGRSFFLKNMKSNVVITHWGGDTLSQFQFRNTPTFFSDNVSEVRDALYETEAGLDQYFYNKNTGPFVALRLIQRFGISNPSPRFIQSVTKAFRSGRFDVPYTQGLPSFGSGRYGDLSSTVAAILLDRESRNVLLDADFSFGSIREPVIKLISLMRSMKYVQTDSNQPFPTLYNADSNIGQMAHDIPSVFSFFLPEYASPGKIAESSLVAPEAMLLHNSVGLLNGMISLVRYGMTSCYGGFGPSQCLRASKDRIVDIQNTGHLSYEIPGGPTSRTEYADFIVDNLATMLTSGRMSRYNRKIVREAYLSKSDKTEGLKLAQTLTILSPEFHTTGIPREKASKRAPATPATKVCKDYKAVVHIQLSGGMDSYNLLVPHSQCQGKDMYEEYKNVRGRVALPKEDLLPIEVEDQICGTFGIHPNFPLLKDLYDEKEASFLAGIGVLSEPVTKDDYEKKTQTELFAHNMMTHEANRLDPFNQAIETGNLGRLADHLTMNSRHVVNAFSIDSNADPIEGKRRDITKASVNSKLGFKKFNPSAFGDNDDVGDKFAWLNGEQDVHSSKFTETWSSSVHETISATERLHAAENSVKLSGSFPSSKLGNKLSLISKMIGSKDCRGTSRDIFYVSSNSFDHHANVIDRLKYEFDDLNAGLKAFIDEIKSLPNNIWNDVVIVASSEFGRTLTGNSNEGTDHGWSGNNFIIGGNINGGKTFGTFPTDLTINSPLNVGRGRLIPTMPFEAPWNAVIEWLGVTNEDEIDKILPNRRSFPSEMLLRKDELFVEDKNINPIECNNEGHAVFCEPIMDEDLEYE